jgi:molecular chaperone GrpE
MSEKREREPEPSREPEKPSGEEPKGTGRSRRRRISWKRSASRCRRELEAAREELAELKEKSLRQLAEFQNYRRRVEEEKRELRENARARSLGEVLHLFDMLDMALTAAEQGHNPADLIQGLRMIEHQWRELLAGAGVKPVPGVGEPFDPALHEAVRTDETGEVEPGRITAVLRKGFRLRDKVLRVAQVAVSSAPAGEADEEEAEPAAGEEAGEAPEAAGPEGEGDPPGEAGDEEQRQERKE